MRGMIRVCPTPQFDHGAALRVPPAADAHGWSALMAWLGNAGRRLAGTAVEVDTRNGRLVASVGDWVVLSVSGHFHVAVANESGWDA
ncbi:MAG TPA: hypothetical protein VD906_12260 [Caulobacteraceae bacterium]|nr:hypothetical protein [Caulobacteraceae bacterium]